MSRVREKRLSIFQRTLKNKNKTQSDMDRMRNITGV